MVLQQPQSGTLKRVTFSHYLYFDGNVFYSTTAAVIVLRYSVATDVGDHQLKPSERI